MSELIRKIILPIGIQKAKQEIPSVKPEEKAREEMTPEAKYVLKNHKLGWVVGTLMENNHFNEYRSQIKKVKEDGINKLKDIGAITVVGLRVEGISPEKLGELFNGTTGSIILEKLKRNPKISMPKICDNLHLSPLSIRKEFKKLEEAGLLERDPDNKRIFFLVENSERIKIHIEIEKSGNKSIPLNKKQVDNEVLNSLNETSPLDQKKILMEFQHHPRAVVQESISKLHKDGELKKYKKYIGGKPVIFLENTSLTVKKT